MPQSHVFAARALRSGVSVMPDHLRKGARVLVQGLEKKLELNGLRGTLASFDSASNRWAVRLDEVGFRKIKIANLLSTQSDDVGSQLKLYRYGQKCHRPELWYRHEDEEAHDYILYESGKACRQTA